MGNFRDLARLSSDVDLKYVGKKDTPLATFSIAVQRAFAGSDGVNADFHRCQAWGKRGEAIEKYFKKGDRIFIDGELQNNNYEDKSGNKHYGYLINVTDFKFVENKKDKQAQDDDSMEVPPPPEQATMSDDFVEVPSGVQGDVPFFSD